MSETRILFRNIDEPGSRDRTYRKLGATSRSARRSRR